MRRREFLRRWSWRFGVSLVLICILVYTLLHVFSSSSASLMTTPVKTITDTQLLRGTAYLFRDETVLSVDAPALIDEVAVSGSKVGQGRELLRVYPTAGETREAAQEILDRLNRLCILLEESRVPGGESLSSAAEYRQGANEAFLELCRAVREGRLSEVGALEDEMLWLLNRYQTLIGASESVDAALETVRAEKASLLGEALPTVISNEARSGYFYDKSTVDGYEGIYTAAAAEALTAESFAALTATSPAKDSDRAAVGKMAYDYKWYLAVSFPRGGELFEAQEQYRVAFPENRGRELTLTCERTLTGANGETVVLLRSDVTPSDFLYSRSQTVEITAATTEGYYVPLSALVTERGTEGVYVFEGSVVSFRRVSVLQRGDGYVIADAGVTEAGYLTLNDILVVSGKNLYDGKVFR